VEVVVDQDVVVPVACGLRGVGHRRLPVAAPIVSPNRRGDEGGEDQELGVVLTELPTSLPVQ
jgi:hypothetical protein